MKKLISTVLAAALTLSLAACGSTAASSTSEAASGSEAASTASSETASDASDAVDFTGDGYDAAVDYASLAGTTIKVAASPVPHAEILKVLAISWQRQISPWMWLNIPTMCSQTW